MDVENLIAALECHDRIFVILISSACGPGLENLLTVLHKPFPILNHFSLRSNDESVPVLPENFLGGFAPRLQSFGLEGVPFPSFPKLILRFPQVTHLRLFEIPNSGYISPDVMVTCLEALSNLESFSIGFRSPPSRLLRSSPPRLIHAILPTLSDLTFSGVSEYFEDFVSRINAPRLTCLRLTFFMDLIFDIPRLCNFIDHTEGIKPFNHAIICCSSRAIEILFGLPAHLELKIICERPDWQLSSMTQIFSQQLPLLSHVEQLEIRESSSSRGELEWKDDSDMDPSQWLELFRLFVAAQSLRMSGKLVSPVTRALQDLTGQMATEILPAPQNLYLEGPEPSGPVHEAMKPFATARQLSHQPVVIQRWDQWQWDWEPRFHASDQRWDV
jgi:hypothetical protein